jgi:nicotinate phosphoribosyltransferase
MSALNTDFYQLTMAAGYFAAGKTEDVATFELHVRRLPENRNFLVAAGLQQATEYLQNFRFERDEIDYLQSLPQFSNVEPEFFKFLLDLRFTGDLFAVPEGTPLFPGEPVAIVRAPIVQAQLAETFLLSTFAFQTSVASKAARCVIAAEGRPVIEFGSRRAHSPAAGVLAGRAAYLAGCAGTSNAETGRKFGVPVSGTAAHSWVMAFDKEEEAFRALQSVLGEFTVYLIDTYNTIEAAQLVTRIGGAMTGVRLDSGNLDALSRQVRQILDGAGMGHAKIMATNDLDEYRIRELVSAGAPIDSFGVGTQLATSADAPALSAIYKLVELRRGEVTYYTAKYSDEKGTLPGAKQVFRGKDQDTLALSTECSSDENVQPLVRPVLIGGQALESLPKLGVSREYALRSIAALPESLRSLSKADPHPIVITSRLRRLADKLQQEHHVSGASRFSGQA